MEGEKKNASSNEEGGTAEETSITMLDVLEEEKELEEEYAAVLGASDEKRCTYTEGAIVRQALYSCLTCCPESRENLEKCAGICLACSYHCHENHELIELYTKRNFRCDCPTERMGANLCRLNNIKNQLIEGDNVDNKYNQNFQGLYCNCHRPYPDPDITSEQIMLQCIICEDWFHLEHLNGLPSNASKLVESCSEMICDACMNAKAFLNSYRIFSLNENEKQNESAEVDIATLPKDNDNKLHSDLDKSIADIMNIDGPSTSKRMQNNDDLGAYEPNSKKPKLEKKQGNDCRRPKCDGITISKGPTFWANEWRAQLCRCPVCMEMYKREKVEYLLKEGDTITSYEERGKKRIANESSNYERGIQALASINRVQQIDAITEYNRMKDRLIEYLHTFAVNKKVVTEDDIKRFFNEMSKERSADVYQPHFCR